MEINKVLEILNTALCDRDLTIWLQKEEIKKLKQEKEELKTELEEMRAEVNE